MGGFARYPIALAPGMGLNAYFTYVVVKGMGIPWQAALGAVEANAELFRQYKGFAEPVPVRADAPVLDRVLAASGRDLGWAPDKDA